MKVVVVGGGIIGLAVARQILIEYPDTDLVLLEKEHEIAAHQSSHNSGVVHTGIYYEPGSLKATLCRQGRALLHDYCLENDLPYEICGKLVVAVEESERGRLNTLYERASKNGVSGLRLVDGKQISEIEPHVVGVAAIHSAETAIVDFRQICYSYARDIAALGGIVYCDKPVTRIDRKDRGVIVSTNTETFPADAVITCAGLFADHVGLLAGDVREPQIVPFRGEFYRLRPDKAAHVRGLIYPVPDPRYPFLGVHLTRRIDGNVDIGPNAVLALAREGYTWGNINFSDLREIFGSRGFWNLARKNWRVGAYEVAGSLSRSLFVRRAQRYMPELTAADVEKASAGVRAQTIGSNGSLLDDFRISHLGPVTVVRNAPSPAATSSLAIPRHLVKELPLTAA